MKVAISIAREQGPRSYQEDYYVHLPILSEGARVGDLLAVMDGHVGKFVAEYCAKNIERFFTFLGPDKTEEALQNLVTNLTSQTANQNSGSTISIALVVYKPLKVSVAVLGDSPVVVRRSGNKLHVSPEHNVRSNLEERKMAEKRGGIYHSGYLYASPVSSAGLQFSRALGNAYMGKVLLREPEIYTLAEPQWILLASDGIFDPGHADTERLLKEIESHAEKHANAQSLMRWAQRRKLKDNATAIVWSSK